VGKLHLPLVDSQSKQPDAVLMMYVPGRYSKNMDPTEYLKLFGSSIVVTQECIQLNSGRQDDFDHHAWYPSNFDFKPDWLSSNILDALRSEHTSGIPDELSHMVEKAIVKIVK